MAFIFNNAVNQLLSIDIKISYEDKCISFLCSLPDSWDSLVIAIGSNATALHFDEIVSSLLTKEMRRKIWRARMVMPCLYKDGPRIETKITHRVGDLNLEGDLNLQENL